MTTKYTKPSNAKVSATAETRVFPKEVHTLRPSSEALPPGMKGKKRDNIFSQSRDNREDRGEREIKTSHNPQTMHGRP
jgi:hypothetical protein